MATEIFTALFPHDNVFFLLEKEQKHLDSLTKNFSPAKNSTKTSLKSTNLPFSPFLPLCPIKKEIQTSNPRIGDLQEVFGWIIRPIFFASLENLEPILFTPKGYPQTPNQLGFILGYAGKEAKKIVRICKNTPSKLDVLSLRVWYFSNVKLSFGSTFSSPYFCKWECGKARWVKSN